MKNAYEIIENFTPGEIGIIAATLDSVDDLSDDIAVDILTNVIGNEIIPDDPQPDEIAYLIVHNLGREI